MEKISRKIFQPNFLSNFLVKNATINTNISDFMNHLILDYYTPSNPLLKKEVEFLFLELDNHDDITPNELKATLSRCVNILKDFPIRDSYPLEQIFLHFTLKSGRILRYDYIQIVDDVQDQQLHHLNEVLKTLDPDFNLGMRELGERSSTVFAHWEQLCQYSEIYTVLSTIINCENIYYPLDTFRVIDLIRLLDCGIQSSNLSPIKSAFETNISLRDKYRGIDHEICVYQTDNGYCALSGDYGFEHMSPEIRKYYDDYVNHPSPCGEITIEDINTISAIEKRGRLLFRRLQHKNH